MTTRTASRPPEPANAVDTRPVFGREWWGLDRDRLEDELARQDRTRPGEPRPH